MSILRDFEKRLEGAVEGFFARAFRSGLQPVEMAKAVQRYQADYQHVGVDAVYVPNVYRFTLSEQDLQRFSGFTRSLQRELADVARRTADDKGWRTQGPIRIEFERNDEIRVGTFELRGKSEAPAARRQPQPQPSPVAAPRPQPQPAAQPSNPQPAAPQPVGAPSRPSDYSGAEAAGPATHTPILRAVEGSDAGKVFPLTSGATVVGRLPECEITLTGAAVSRRHARIQQEGDRFTITDLGSTNGIRVNGQTVQVAEITPGDRVEVGDITFSFLLSGG